jgi:hypothetical protein
MRTHTITDREEYEQWQFEYKLVDNLLRSVEQAEQALLIELRCPIDPVAIYAILTGERPAPWRRRMSARARTRALHAMHSLVQIQTARRHLALGEENSRLAAQAALLAGLHANNNDAAINATLVKSMRRGQRAGGWNRWKNKPTEKKDIITRHKRAWDASDELSDSYTSCAAYIRAKTGYPESTIRYHLKRRRK